MNIHDRPATIFCDIDGTLIKHSHPNEASKNGFKAGQEYFGGLRGAFVDDAEDIEIDLNNQQLDEALKRIILNTGRK